MKRTIVSAAIAAVALAGAASAQTVVLEEDFSDATAAAANFEAVPTGDWSVDFSFDYSSTVISTGTSGGSPVNGTNIPPAPNNDGGAPTTALRLGVNLTGGLREAINVFTSQTFSGDYQVEVDVYYFHDGNSGSTEDPMLGINHSGDFPIKLFTSSLPHQDQTDGYWFKAHGDVDVSGPDYFFIKGADGAAAQTGVNGLTWGDGLDPELAGRDWNLASDGTTTTTLFEDNFNGFRWGADEPGGAMRWAWTTLRIDNFGGIIDLYANDAFIASYIDPEAEFTSGRVMLGLEDSFGGSNAGNFGLFTNLKVTSFATNVQDWTMY